MSLIPPEFDAPVLRSGVGVGKRPFASEALRIASFDDQ